MAAKSVREREALQNIVRVQAHEAGIAAERGRCGTAWSHLGEAIFHYGRLAQATPGERRFQVGLAPKNVEAEYDLGIGRFMAHCLKPSDG